MTHEYHYDWHVDLKSTPEALWPFVADTNRFNHDTGLPPIRQITDAPDILPGAHRLQFTLLGLRFTWDEEPFEWIFPQRFGVVRHYRNPFLDQMRVAVEMSTSPTGGTHLHYQTWVRPKNLIGDLGILVQVGLISARKFVQIFKIYDEIIQSGGSPYDVTGRARFATGGRERLAAAKSTIVQAATDENAYSRLAHLIETADDLALQRLRPYQLADHWQLPRRAVLEAFLRATRAGVFDMRWELLCPGCRGAAASHASLNEVHSSAHCGYCNIDFSANFDRQVEVIFRPNPAVRSLPDQLLFCVAGPQTRPHLLVNEQVAAGAELDVAPHLTEGRYSLSAASLPGELPVVVTEDGAADELVSINEDGWPEAELRLGSHPLLHLVNQTTAPLTFSLVRTAWRDDAATAADVTSLQLFRDLFSREALRAGEEISISSVTLMFTDLRDSTRLYRQIGDAPAFGRVRQHFDLLEQAIATEGGAIVKTMGDAVMAVFRQPVSAFRAIKSAHAAIARAEGTPPLDLKVGIHTGPCIVVTLNERLDYFGSTVNIAARLPGLAQGGEVIFSPETCADPEVEIWIHENTAIPNWFESNVKGFDEPFKLWRLDL